VGRFLTKILKVTPIDKPNTSHTDIEQNDPTHSHQPSNWSIRTKLTTANRPTPKRRTRNSTATHWKASWSQNTTANIKGSNRASWFYRPGDLPGDISLAGRQTPDKTPPNPWDLQQPAETAGKGTWTLTKIAWGLMVSRLWEAKQEAEISLWSKVLRAFLSFHSCQQKLNKIPNFSIFFFLEPILRMTWTNPQDSTNTGHFIAFFHLIHLYHASWAW
jgi:hypothetical protein